MSHLPARVACLFAVVAVVGLTACGGDDSGTEGSSNDTAAPNDDDGSEVVLTSQEVCDALPVEVVTEAVGLSVIAAEAGDSGATPQCAYTYESDAGGQSNLTIASMDSTAVGSLTGDDAFDFVADINRQSAGGTDVEEVDVDAGDRAVRFTGPGVHLGIVSTDGHILTVIVPIDADALAVDALLVAVASSVGG